MTASVYPNQALSQRLRRLWDQFLALLETAAASGDLSLAIEGSLNVDSSNPSVESYLKLLSSEGTVALESLPRLALADGDAMAGAAGAYVEALNRIVINSSWLASASDAEVLRVLAEEYGHSLDALLNSNDTIGDEGERFAALLLGYEAPASSAFEDDAITVTINGIVYSAEAATLPTTGFVPATASSTTLENTDTASSDLFIIGQATASVTSANILHTIKTGGGTDTIRVLNHLLPSIDPTVSSDQGSQGIEILEIGGATYIPTSRGPATTNSISLADATVTVNSVAVTRYLSGVERLYLQDTVTLGYNLTGNTLNNIIVGGQGADTINGGAGNDTLFGRRSASGPGDTITDASGSNTFIDWIDTASLSDTTAPTVSNADGVTLSQRLYPNSNLVLQFSENIQRTQTGLIKVERVDTGATVASYDSGSTRVFATGKTLSIDPDGSLPLTNLRLAIENGAISDLVGNRFAAQNFTFTPFSLSLPDTSFSSTPSIYSPTPNQSVGPLSNIKVTFGEEIQRAASNSTASNFIRLVNVTDSTTTTTVVPDLFDPNSTRWAILNSSNIRSAYGQTIAFDPTQPLVSGKTYRLEIQSGAITDRSGNPFAGTSNTFSVSSNASNINTETSLLSTSQALSSSTSTFKSDSNATTTDSTLTTSSLTTTSTVSATSATPAEASTFYIANRSTRLILPAYNAFLRVEHKGAINQFPTTSYPLNGEQGWLIVNFFKANNTDASPTKVYALRPGLTEPQLVARLIRDKKADASVTEDLSAQVTNTNQVSVIGNEKITLDPILEDTPQLIITPQQINPGIGVAANLGIRQGNGSVSSNSNGSWTYTPARNDDTGVLFSADVLIDGKPQGTYEIELDLLPVNDAPEQTGTAAAPIIVEEDSANSTAQSLGLSSLAYSQGGTPFVETTQNLTFTITGIPSFIKVFNGPAEVVVDTTFTGTGTSAFNTFKTLTYKTVPDANGNVTNNGLNPGFLTWTVTDNGLTANEGVDTLAQSLAITVNPVNDAPVASGDTSLTAIQEGDNNPPGARIDSLFTTTANFSDAADQVAGGSSANTLAGIAISSYIREQAKGEWQYSSNGGSNWNSILSSITSANSALTLQSSDRLRFLPSENFFGSAPALSVKLIDSSTSVSTGVTVDASGGGTSAFSSGSVTLSHTVDAVNDAPQNTLPAEALTGNEDTDLAITGLGITDVDAGSGTMTVTLTVTRGRLTIAAASGVNLSGNGTASVRLSGTLSAINTALAANNGVLYSGNLNFNGTDTLTMTTDDGGNTGSGGAKSDTDTLSITVNPVNDAPVASGSATLTGVFSFDTNPPGATVESLFTANFSDAADDQVPGGSSANTLLGVVIDGNAATSAEGMWQWSSDGITWTDIATDSTSTDNTGLFLAASTRLRFLPNPNFSGTPGGLTARLVDNSIAAPTNAASGPTSFGTPGGTSAYSAGTVALGTSIESLPTPNPTKLIWVETKKTDTTVLLDPGNVPLYKEGSADPILNVTLSGIGGVPNLHTASNGSDARIGIGNTFMDQNEALIINLPQQQTQEIRLDFWGGSNQQGIGLTGTETAILEASGITANGTLITKSINLNNASLKNATPGTSKANSYTLSITQFDTATTPTPSTSIVAFTKAKVTAGANSQFELDFGLKVQADVYYGTTAADTIQTGVTPAIIYALAGNDNITAANGDDLIWAGPGSNRIDGGLGRDFFAFQKDDSITPPNTTPSTNTIVTADLGLSGDLLLFKNATGVSFTGPTTGNPWQATVTWLNDTETFQFLLPTGVALAAGPTSASLSFQPNPIG